MKKIKEIMTRIIRKKDALTAFAMALLVVGAANTAHAVEPQGFALNFDPSQMFVWTQSIIDMMMPVVYITLGISLAFIIIRALKSAFSY
ncbi:hypothetical protein [Anaerotalea alkaliphila]|uniref:Uncharacterized protein n=1 Tax=Anaerotalea alkaliphila TaxID=2662126 RepID=A0A7X5HW19_9FIRM|nr:hypothetical protein [Anaerotalea alkaliphila]NDL67702.1 hypothetical protein [Anaerotalea alkaliphila]